VARLDVAGHHAPSLPGRVEVSAISDYPSLDQPLLLEPRAARLPPAPLRRYSCAVQREDTMVRCTCCEREVAELVEAPRTGQLVCARCLSLIRGMMGVWDVLIASARRRQKQCDA